MDTPRTRYTPLSFAILLLAALLGNYLSVPLFFGVDFLFGSIAVLIAVRMLGPLAGSLIATLAGLYTVYLWGHPYALIIFVLEAAVVGLLLRRVTRNLLLADMIYWVLCGAPLVWLFYGQVMDLGPAQVLLIALKQPINGLVNAMVATFILMALPPRWNHWFPALRRSKRLALSDLMFSLLLATAFLPALSLSIYESHTTLKKLEATVAEGLRARAHTVQRYLAQYGQGVDLKQLQRIFVTDTPHQGLTLLGPSDEALLNGAPNKRGAPDYLANDTRTLGHHLQLWLPPRGDTPFMLWWKQARYFTVLATHSGPVAKIIVSRSSEPTIRQLASLHTETFTVLVLVALIGALVSALISHLLTRPLRALSRITHDLPYKLNRGLDIEWPDNRINELHHLTNDTRKMATSLGRTLLVQRQTHETLELRVTERTTSLKETAARTQAIIENAVEGIVTIDETGCIESFNPMAERLFGYHADEVIGRNVKLLMPEPHKSLHDDYIAQYLSGGPPRIIGSMREVEGLRKDGSLFPFELSISEVQLQGRRIFTGFVRDISERKANEKLKNEFIANVSHELRTPLTAIHGTISLLAGGAVGTLPAQAASMLKIAQNNSERLRLLVNDILDIQRLESGNVSLTLQSVLLLPLIERAIDDNRPYAAQYKVSIVLETTLPVSTTLYTDPDRLAQVMANLLSNAAKFSPEGGVITLALSLHDQQVRITVADQGEGVPEAFRTSLFDKFAQADGSSTREHGGTGLGLHISRAIVHLLGGNIGFIPGEERGAVFFVELPATAGPRSTTDRSDTVAELPPP